MKMAGLPHKALAGLAPYKYHKVANQTHVNSQMRRGIVLLWVLI